MIKSVLRGTLLLGLVATAAVAVRSWLDVIDVSPVFREQNDSAARKPEPTVRTSIPDLQNLSETRERPLFATDRRPRVAPNSEQQPSQPPSLSLVGLLHPSAAPARVLLRVDGRRAKWVDVGTAIEGYTVQEVRSGIAIMVRDGRSFELRLQRRSAAADTP